MSEVNTDFNFKGKSFVQLKSCQYMAVIAPDLGSSVVRLRDEQKKVEIFRYREDSPVEEIINVREIWGLPTLYLPNRFDGGILRTSDAVYHLPINEKPLGNYIHGFVHKRAHIIEKAEATDEKAVLITSFTFDEKDEMFEYFPLKFKISYTFTLSAEGLRQEINLTSYADKKLPVSLCTHTCINAPICDGGEEKTLRMSVPIAQKCELDSRCLPTEKLMPLSDWDLEYKNGTKMPTLQNISNDMYTADMNKLDGHDFYGIIITDTSNGIRICNEVSEQFKFWNMWNHDGDKGYFCPEPMTAMINAPNLNLPREITGYAELEKDEAFTCWQRFFVL